MYIIRMLFGVLGYILCPEDSSEYRTEFRSGELETRFSGTIIGTLKLFFWFFVAIAIPAVLYRII